MSRPEQTGIRQGKRRGILLVLLVLMALSLLPFCGCKKGEDVNAHTITLTLNEYGGTTIECTGLFTGTLVEGLPSGQGTFECTGSDGVYWSYEGDWSNGHMNGTGSLVWGSADTYAEQGTYQNDLFTSGTISCSEYVYEGPVGEQGRYSGSGKLTFTSGPHRGCYYEGNFANGAYNGHGEFHYADGRWYEGDFVDDEFCGTGTFHNADGSYYTGTWLDDQLNGPGAYYDADGNLVESGTYENGILIEKDEGSKDTQKDEATQSPAPGQ